MKKILHSGFKWINISNEREFNKNSKNRKLYIIIYNYIIIKNKIENLKIV